jgi:type IV pilus assembly protein PilE
MNKSGFSLIELLIATAVIAILAAVAIPSYQGYVETSRVNTAKANALSIKPFLEEFYLETGSYIKDSDTSYNRSDLTDYFGWSADLDNDWTYVVTASSDTWSITLTKGDWSKTYTKDDLKL